jgi:hypothetical protein
MWCWGCDVRRREGNVLLQYGCERWPPPAGIVGSSAYRLDVPPGRRVVLWGFGMFCGDRADGGLFLKRFAFDPLWCPDPDLSAALWRPESPPEFHPPRAGAERSSALRLLSATMRWIAEYETWVQSALGVDYRRRCLRDWRKTVALAESVPGQWLLFAEHCSELLTVAQASGDTQDTPMRRRRESLHRPE